MHKEKRADPKDTKKKKKKLQRERELRKEGRKSLVVSPEVQDQSKRVPLKEASI